SSEPLAGFSLGRPAIGEWNSDASTGVLDDQNSIAKPHSILSRPRDTEIGRKSGQEQALEAALTQPPIQPCCCAPVVLEEGRVAVDLLMKALANDHLHFGQVQIAMQRGVGAVLQCVVWPKHLRAVWHTDRIICLAPRVGTGEGAMTGRMPVLRREGMIEQAQQTVDYRDDCLTIRHR